MTMVFIAAMVAASVIVMVAMRAGIIVQISNEKPFHRVISIAADTAEKPDTRFRQGRLCAAADTAADQRIHFLLL